MPFHTIEENLRESFRVLAAGRSAADVVELPGVSVASLGVAFQMFNAAFLNAPVETQDDLRERLDLARRRFESRALAWSLWICEDWLARPLRRKLSPICASAGLHLAAEMPGMTAGSIDPPRRTLPELEIRAVDSIAALRDFRAIGSTCFHVPAVWFSEVFDEQFDARPGFQCVAGYCGGVPVATAASVVSSGVIGLYNIATLPEFRRRGYAEAITREVIAHQTGVRGRMPVVLQSTAQGLRLYERMGFHAATRIVVYNSARGYHS